MHATPASPLQNLLEHIDRHPSLPVEAILKADLLRCGLSFAPEALASALGSQDHQLKSYFIFSFNMVQQSELDPTHQWKAPEEIALTDGPIRTSADDHFGSSEPVVTLQGSFA